MFPENLVPAATAIKKLAIGVGLRYNYSGGRKLVIFYS